LRFFEMFNQGACAGVRNRSQIFDQFLTGHADAGVADRDRFGILIDADPNFKVGIWITHLLIGHHLELNTVEGVGGVRDQFAQKDFTIGVERMRQNIEQLTHFGAEWHRRGVRGTWLQFQQSYRVLPVSSEDRARAAPMQIAPHQQRATPKPECPSPSMITGRAARAR
jgi:hypothetical protein